MTKPLYITRTRPPASRSPKLFLFLCAWMVLIGFINWKWVIKPELEERARQEAPRSIPTIVQGENEVIWL